MGGISLCNLHCLTTAPHCLRCPSAQQKTAKLATGNFSFRFLPSQGSLRQTICKADCSVVSRMSNFSANTKGDPKNAKCRVSLINKFYKSYLSLKNKTKKTPFGVFFYFGAGGGSRTHTVSLPQDFESSASASSTTPAFRTRYILPLFL